MDPGGYSKYKLASYPLDHSGILHRAHVVQYLHLPELGNSCHPRWNLNFRGLRVKCLHQCGLRSSTAETIHVISNLKSMVRERLMQGNNSDSPPDSKPLRVQSISTESSACSGCQLKRVGSNEELLVWGIGWEWTWCERTAFSLNKGKPPMGISQAGQESSGSKLI